MAKKQKLWGEIALKRTDFFKKKYAKKHQLLKEFNGVLEAHVNWYITVFLSCTVERERHLGKESQ